jgi:hypothetical protein
MHTTPHHSTCQHGPNDETCCQVVSSNTSGCPVYNPKNLRALSDACLFLGFLSIIASVATWFAASKRDDAYGERFGIFIGLWVPSFFILSNRLSRKADEIE